MFTEKGKRGGEHASHKGVCSQGAGRVEGIGVDKVSNDTGIDEQDTHAKDGRANDGRDPVDMRIRGPGKDEDTNGGKDGTADSRRQSKLWLAVSTNAGFLFELRGEVLANAVPDRVGGNAEEHANADTDKGQANLPQVPAVVGAKDQGKSAKEEVENAEEDGGLDAQTGAHWFPQ